MRKSSALLAVSLAVLAGIFGGSAAWAADWIAASSYADAENKWTGETAAYDSSTSSYASDGSNRVGWGAVLKLNYATPVTSDRVRVSTDFGYGIVDKVKLTITYNDNSAVSTEYNGAVVQDVTLSTLTFTKGLVKSVEFSYHYLASGWNFWLYDIKLYQCPDAPAPLSGITLDPTSVNATSAVMHGKVVSNGGSPCYGRFVFWKLVDSKFYSPWRGDLANNQEFTVALSGLEQNAGYSYQVQLAPSATPTPEQIVTADPVKTFTTVKVDESSSEEWVSPGSAWADTGTWENADQAMDDDTATGARFYHQINGESWSPFIHFGTDLQANGIRIWTPGANVDQVDIDILKGGVWQDLYQGVFTGDAWQQFPFEKGLVTEARIRLHASAGNAGFYWNLMEVDFHQKSELRTTRYFVGAGAWNSAANWSATSGGAGGASVPGTGAVAIFDANSPSCTLSGGVSVEVLRLDAAFTGVLDAGGNAITIERNRGFGELRVAGGELKLGSATHTIKDNFRFTGGTITPGTSTVGFLAPNDGSAEVAGNLVLNNVRFYHSNSGSNHKVLAINGTVTTNGSLAIEGYDAGGWNLYLNGGEIVAKGAITGNGKVVRGTSSLTISGGAGDQTQTGLFWGTSGTYTVNKAAGKLVFGANEKFGDPTMSGNAQTKLVLTTEVDADSAQQTVWLCGYGYGGVKITGDLTTYNVNFYRVSGTGTSVYDLSGCHLTVLNNLDLNIPADGGWHVNVAPGTVISCKGNVTATNVTAANWAGATFVISGAGNQSIALGSLPVSTVAVEKTGGTVSFPDGITSTAITLSAGSSVIFGAGKTVQATSIYWRGAEGQPIVLRSSVAGQRWLFDLPDRYVMDECYLEWVDVQDSDASQGEPVVVAVAGTDAGNNLNWDFLLPVDVEITTPAASAVSPAWVEGTVGPNVTVLDVAVNSGTAFAATRDSKMKWFANNSATSAMGVTLSSTEATSVLVTGRTCTGRENSASQSITWTPTDLRGKDAATDSVTIRKGDSLLLTASGSEGELALAIDADGDGTYEFTGVPGDKVVSTFNTAGTVTVSAKIDGSPVGSLKVVVMSVDLHGPIACQVGYQRTKDVVVSPAAEVGRLSFVPADPFYLETSVNQTLADGARLNVKALGRGKVFLQARIGGANGPVVAHQEIDEFTVDLPAKVAALFDGETGVGASTLTMRPFIPGVRFKFVMFSSGASFNGGLTQFYAYTSDSFQQSLDPATGETVGTYDFQIEVPAGCTSYCFAAYPEQSGSDWGPIGFPENSNGDVKRITVTGFWSYPTWFEKRVLTVISYPDTPEKYTVTITGSAGKKEDTPSASEAYFAKNGKTTLEIPKGLQGLEVIPGMPIKAYDIEVAAAGIGKRVFSRRIVVLNLHEMVVADHGRTENSVEDTTDWPEDPLQTLYLVESKEGSATIDLLINKEVPESFAARFLWAIGPVGSTEPLFNACRETGPESFTVPRRPSDWNGAREFSAIAGFDADGNGAIDTSEPRREVKVIILKLDMTCDLDLDGVISTDYGANDQEREQGPGAFVAVNDDDDDMDQVLDLGDGKVKQEDTRPGSQDEDDLKEFRLTNILPASLQDKGKIILSRSNGKIRIYTDKRKGIGTDDDRKLLWSSVGSFSAETEGDGKKTWNLEYGADWHSFFNLLGSGIWVEGVEASSGPMDTEITIAYLPKGAAADAAPIILDTIKITVIKGDMTGDLDLNGAVSADNASNDQKWEQDPGAFVAVNNDDDDMDQVSDLDDGKVKQEATRPGSRDEDDLKELTLANILPAGLQDKGKVILRRSNGKIRVYSDKRKGDPVDNGKKLLWNTVGIFNAESEGDGKKTWDLNLPDDRAAFQGLVTSGLWVEGVEASANVKDTELVISYLPEQVASNAAPIILDVLKITVIKIEMDYARIYDPKLDSAGLMQIKYKITGPTASTEWDPRLELTVLEDSTSTEVSCLVGKHEASPAVGIEITKTWNGRWGIKKGTWEQPGADTTNKDKYVNPGRHKMEMKIYRKQNADCVLVNPYDVFVVRLACKEIALVGNVGAVFHKTTATDTANYNVDDIVWKLKDVDFDLGATAKPRTAAKKEIPPLGENFVDSNNNGTWDAGEYYYDADGNGTRTADLRQANFPGQVPTANKDTSGGVNSDDWNRPVVYVRETRPKLKVKFGGFAISDLTGASVAAGYPVGGGTAPVYPIRIAASFKSKPMKGTTQTAATNTLNISPTLGAYELEADEKLADDVGYAVEAIEFKFQYNVTGESFVDANGNGSYDAGDVLDDRNGDGKYDENWKDVPGKQATTHLVYRVAGPPTATSLAQGGGKTFMKIVDFTCTWAPAGTKTSQGVFNAMWASSKFWTPFTANHPSNAAGFHGIGDPKEALEPDRWGTAPMCYTYRHDLGLGQTVDDWLDRNYGRCGGWSRVLPAFAGTHGFDCRPITLNVLIRRERAGTVTYLTIADVNAGGNAAGDVLWLHGSYFGLPDDQTGIRVKATIDAQANPASGPAGWLATYFDNHAVAFHDGNGNGVFEPALGEKLYDGSYDHSAGTLNASGYGSVKALEDAAISEYVYRYRLTITGVDAAGKITTGVRATGPFSFPNDTSACEMEATP